MAVRRRRLPPYYRAGYAAWWTAMVALGAVAYVLTGSWFWVFAVWAVAYAVTAAAR